jgi:uncharacterized membrane protein YfcA
MMSSFTNLPLAELATLCVWIVGGGAITGFLAGLLGIGGGGIIVPVLYEIFRVLDVPEDVRMQLCIGTSLAIIIPTAIRSSLAHHARGAVSRPILRRWLIPILVGVGMGSLLAAFAPAWLLKLLFALIAGTIGVKFLFGRDSWRLGSELPAWPLMSVYGFIIGFYSSVMGVGGGSVAITIMTLYAVPIHTAVGTSAALAVLISLSGIFGYILAGWPHMAVLPPLSLGYVSIIGLVLMAPVSALTAPLGARVAHQLSKRHLELALGVFLTLVALRFVIALI